MVRFQLALQVFKLSILLGLLQNQLPKAQEEESRLLVAEPDPVKQKVQRNQAPQVRGSLIDPDQGEGKVGEDQSQFKEHEAAATIVLRIHHHPEQEVTEEEDRSLQGGEAEIAGAWKGRRRRGREASLLAHPQQGVRAEKEEIKGILQELPPRESREPI